MLKISTYRSYSKKIATKLVITLDYNLIQYFFIGSEFY